VIVMGAGVNGYAGVGRALFGFVFLKGKIGKK